MVRFLKQFFYGIFYLSILALAAGAVYATFLKTTASCFDNIKNQNETGVDCGGVCGISCELKALRPLTFSEPKIFANNGLISLLVEVSNPNPNYGSDNFEYQINFYDSENKLLDSQLKSSFIYAGETKELVEAGLAIPGNPAKAEITLEKINWKPVTDWQTPILETSNPKFSLSQGAVTVSGQIHNPSNFDISEVIVIAVLLDNFNREIGVSKTELKNLAPFQQMNFQVFVPLNPLVKDRINLNATRVAVKARR